MSDAKNEKQPRKKLDAERALKLREHLVDRMASLTDEELEAVAGGTEVPTVVTIWPPVSSPSPIIPE
jgi:hypothetical protein